MTAEIKQGLPTMVITTQYNDSIEATIEPETGDLYLTIENEEGFSTAFMKPKDAVALTNFILGRTNN